VAVTANAGAAIPRQRASTADHGPATVHAAAPPPPPTRWTVHADLSGATVAEENRFPGDAAWAVGPASGTRASSDVEGPIQAYAGTTSVQVGTTVAFHVSMKTTGTYQVAIWRAGHYGGKGARLMASTAGLHGGRGALPAVDPLTFGVTASWPVGVEFEVPAHFMPGLYYATFTSDGFRHVVPFVVRDDRRNADLCVVLPFTTYQAYNLWPTDKVIGTSLYLGYDAQGDAIGDAKAASVSFNRPFSGGGLPHLIDGDQFFIGWAEQQGYDMTYATSLDVHGGSFDPSRFKGLVFPGHDEYWSDSMRVSLAEAVRAGVGVAFLGANNVYWRIRFSPAVGRGEQRTLDCYKDRIDPLRAVGGRTSMWRSYDGTSRHSEQAILGTQFIGIVKDDTPLVVRRADHWLWSGTGVADGDEIPALVGIEADGIDPTSPTVVGGTWTLLSESPFLTRYDTPNDPDSAVQQTSVWETPHGGVVFNAGTLRWTRALYKPGRVDQRVRRATQNILSRMING
jgi:hypothetical protein